jgi:hypothetical protein
MVKETNKPLCEGKVTDVWRSCQLLPERLKAGILQIPAQISAQKRARDSTKRYPTCVTKTNFAKPLLISSDQEASENRSNA